LNALEDADPPEGAVVVMVLNPRQPPADDNHPLFSIQAARI
jgi:hypothetical protein